MSKTIIKSKNKEEVEEIKNVSYQLPAGWKWVRLEKVLKKEPQYGYTASATSKNTGIKFLRITDIQNNNVVWERVPYVEINNTHLEKYKIAINDFVFARTGSTTGKTYRIRSLPEEDYVIFASYLIRITPALEKVEPRFLEYFFLSNEYWKQIITKGSSKPNFNAKKLKQILIPLPFKNGKPDLEKQKQIVERIETIFKEVDKIITLRQKALEDTKKLFESVLNKIFKEAEEDKENWKWVKLKEIAEKIKAGGTPSRKEKKYWENGTIPWVKISDIQENEFLIRDTEEKITDEGLKNSSAKLFKKGTLLFSIFASIGKVGILDIDAATNQAIVGIELKERIDTKFMAYLLKYFSQDLISISRGNAQNNINQTILKNLLIPIPIKNGKPDLEKQKEIAEYLDNLHNKIKQLEELQQTQIEKFKQLKESILNKAFRGKLV